MRVGLPAEIKPQERRVALAPVHVAELVRAGHEVGVQSGAGLGAGFADDQYRSVGATLLTDAKETYAFGELIVKVKEPLASEWPLLRPDQTLFAYLHLAASRELTEALLKSGVTSIAFETVERGGRLPLLEPMSRVAGRLAAQEGAHHLLAHEQGQGVLLAGLPGVLPAQVVVVGAGMVGSEAARIAHGLGARVIVMDINPTRLAAIEESLPGVNTVSSTTSALEELLPTTSLLIGAVLVPGGKAPQILTRSQLALLPKGAVLVDVAIDQGGCFETSHATTHAEPTYLVDGIVHYAVANMPGAVPRTSSMGLGNAILPDVLRLAGGLPTVLSSDPGLKAGLSTQGGKLHSQAVSDALGLKLD